MRVFNYQSFILGLFILLLCGCVDEEIVSVDEPVWVDPVVPDKPISRATSYTQGLVQNTDGTWTPTQRVPLVGMGRIVDDYANGLIGVATGNRSIENIVDLDLNNYAVFGDGVANIQAVANQIVSVRDLHHVYKAGTRVGFVFNSAENNLLTVDLLKGFWLETSLTDDDGENTVRQESNAGDGSGGLLGLDLISVGNDNGLKEISFITKKDFNEIKIGISGVNIEALGKGGLQIFYAFVGENEIKPAVKGSRYYPNAALHKGPSWTRGITADWNIVDGDITNSGGYSLLGAIVQPCVTVKFGEEIPAGSEVGFEVNFADILNLELGGTISLKTYDDNDQEQDAVSITKVLGLNLVKGAHRRISLVTTKPCTQLYVLFAGLNVKLGATNIFYAYARDKVTVDESSIFSMPSNVNISGNSLLLPSPKGGTMSWFVTGSQPETYLEVKQFGNRERLVGMTKNGTYSVSGIYTPNDNQGSQIKVNFQITRNAVEPSEKCNQLIGTKYGATVSMCHGFSGALLDLSNIKNRGNIVDDNPYNYATFVQGLNIAENTGLVAVKLGNGMTINSERKKIRAGFTLQTSFNLLSLDVLKFFVIKLYKGNEKVDESYWSSSQDKFSSVGLGLVGSKSDRFRVFIETDKEFDSVELWSAGVLGLKLQGQNIYNAFWESAESGQACSAYGIEEAGLEFITPLQFGGRIHYDKSWIGGLVAVGGTFADLGKLIDNNKHSHTLISNTTVVGGGQIAVKFDEIETNNKDQRVGLVMNNAGINVDLLNSSALEVYHNNVQIRRISYGDLLKLNVAGNNGLEYIEAVVNQNFDEVRFVTAGVGTVLQVPMFKGVFLRLDADGDGIPDGSEGDIIPPDPVEPPKTLTATITPEDVCENDHLTITITDGYEEDVKYKVICYNETTQERIDRTDCTVTPGQQIDIDGLSAGQYLFYVLKQDDERVRSVEMRANVHPLRTTWKLKARDTDWNNWENWEKGTPWHCTDVILPSSCNLYPVLTKGGSYFCNNIHFDSRAELVGAQYLNYDGCVWVDIQIPAGRDYMLSAPLCNMVTGDMFVPTRWGGDHSREQYFVNLTSVTSPENRFSPRIYQRFWSSNVSGKILVDGDLEGQQTLPETEIICSETGWTKTFNAVAEPYRPGTGFSVRVEKEALADGLITFRFPKTHTEYNYFDSYGQLTGAKEYIERTANMGHFAFEELNNHHVTVENVTADHTVFVAGNPYMAHLSIEKFLKKNSALISEVKLNDGNTNHTVKYIESTGQFEYSSSNFKHIAPKQGFYVVAKMAAKSLDLQFTDDMQELRGADIPFASRVSVSQTGRMVKAKDGRVLNITAHSNGFSSSCVVAQRRTASDEFLDSEDSRLLYDVENSPTVAVFTVAEGQALDIQQMQELKKIPLGFRMEQEGPVELIITHTENSVWKNWKLEDRLTGKSYSFGEAQTYVNLNNLTTQVGRFFLVKQ